MKKNIFNKETFLVITALIICFLFHVAVINQFPAWLCTDTDGYWLHAATFTGRDWSGVAANLSSYYSWGYSILLTIPLLISSDIIIMSKIAVLINIILNCLTLLLTYSLAKKIAPKIDRKLLLLFSLVVSLYSTYIMESAVVLTESLLYFLCILIIWLLCKYIDTKKMRWALLLSLSIGYIYIVHNRCIGVVAAYLCVSVLLIIKNKNIKEALALMIPLVILLLVNVLVNNWLEVMEAGSKTNFVSNTYSSVLGKTKDKMSFYAILSIAQSFLGSIWYTLVGTFLLAGVGIHATIKKIVSWKEKCDSRIVLNIFLVMNWFFMLMVSVIACFRGSNSTALRIDNIFYGRYMEFTIGIFILIGLIEMCTMERNHEKVKEWGLVLLCAVFLSILVHYFVLAAGGTGINYFSVVAVLLPFFHFTREFSVAAASMIEISFSIIIMYLMLMKGKTYKYIAGVACAAFFVFIGYNAAFNTSLIQREPASVVNNPTLNPYFNDIKDYLSDNEIDEFSVLTYDGYEAFSYQIVLNDKKVTGIVYEDTLPVLEEGSYIVMPQNIDASAIHKRVVHENEMYYIMLVE